MHIRDRIKELRRVPANQLLPNPKNWRTHPTEQADTLKGLLAEVGYADAVLARETEHGLMLVDGHLRAEVAPESVIPVLVLDINEIEADLVLASHDPLAAMATTDATKLAELLAELDTQNAAVQQLFDQLAAQAGVFEATLAELPELPFGDRGAEQITFTLAPDQAQDVRRALKVAKEQGPFIDTNNENANGNALARIVETYLGGAA